MNEVSSEHVGNTQNPKTIIRNSKSGEIIHTFPAGISPPNMTPHLTQFYCYKRQCAQPNFPNHLTVFKLVIRVHVGGGFRTLKISHIWDSVGIKEGDLNFQPTWGNTQLAYR